MKRVSALVLCAGSVIAGSVGFVRPANASSYVCESYQHVIRVREDDPQDSIKADDIDRLNSALVDCLPNRYLGPIVIDLFSGGGSVVGALKVSTRLANLSNPVWTRVGKGAYCISACTYIFLAGKVREVEASGSFEPHAFSSWRGEAAPKLQMIAGMSPELTAYDPGFGWFNQFFTKPERGTDGSAHEWMNERYEQLLPQRRVLVAQLVDILEKSMSELQRQSALAAFRGRSLPASEINQHFTTWVSDAFAAALSAKRPLVKGHDRPTLSDDARQKIFMRQQDVAIDTAETVNALLAPYLATRTDVDLDALIKFMFSTTIIYMRPMTSEELCDSNIVNKNCND